MQLASFSAFSDELLKIAADQDEKSWAQRHKYLLGGLGGAAIGAGAYMLGRPMLRRQLSYGLSSALKGRGAAARELTGELPAGAIENAKKIWSELAAQGIDPRTARIGISGTGGTGKTTLSRALAQVSGMEHIPTDVYGKSLIGRDLAGYVKKNSLPNGAISEQTHLLNQVDPDMFDAIVRVHKDPRAIQQQLMQRGRGAAQWEFYNYPKLHEAIRTGFERTKGEIRAPAPGVQYKIRPKGGFQAGSELDAALRAKGIDPAGMDRQAKIFSLTEGAKPLTPGLVPLVRGGSVAAGAAAVGGGAGLGAGSVYLRDRLAARKGLPEEGAPVEERGAELPKGLSVRLRSIPRVALPAEGGVRLRKIRHLPVP